MFIFREEILAAFEANRLFLLRNLGSVGKQGVQHGIRFASVNSPADTR